MQFRNDFVVEKENSFTPDWVWITIGYTMFLWSALKWIEVNRVTTDLLVAGFFYLSFGLLVKISSGRQTGKRSYSLA
jgi:hypothetical protein